MGGEALRAKLKRSPKAASYLRERNGAPLKTEVGHFIVDVHIDRIDRPGELETALNLIPGVVETGLFVGRTNVLIIGMPPSLPLERSPNDAFHRALQQVLG